MNHLKSRVCKWRNSLSTYNSNSGKASMPKTRKCFGYGKKPSDNLARFWLWTFFLVLLCVYCCCFLILHSFRFHSEEHHRKKNTQKYIKILNRPAKICVSCEIKKLNKQKLSGNEIVFISSFFSVAFWRRWRVREWEIR